MGKSQKRIGFFGVKTLSVFFLVLVGILSLPIAGGLVLLGMERLLEWKDPLKKSDAVVVLSGGARDRVNAAAQIYKDGFARVFIVTRTESDDEESLRDNSRILIRQAVEKGVPQDSIYRTREAADSTYTEAITVRELMELLDLKSCIIVTDPFHSLRTKLVYRDVFANTEIKFALRPAARNNFGPGVGRRNFAYWQMIFGEYGRLVFFLLGFH